MKKSSYFKMNMPEYSDPIDIEDLTDDIETIDTALMTTRCSKTRTTNSINEKAILPYCRVANENEFDITVIDRNFNVEYVIEAGKGKKFEINGANYDMNFMVKDLHEAKFEWFIPVADAIAEGGGGSGGTSNYNDLTNKPQINSVTLSGNKTLADLGITNSSGKIKSDLLPAFVDNYDSYANRAAFPATGVEDRLYLAKDTRLSYVWDSGTSDYVVVGSPLALGESSSTAYRGDRGKTAYDHSQATHANVNATVVAASTTNGNIKIDGVEKTVYTHPKATGSSDTNPHGTTASDIGLGNVGNFKAVSTSSQSLSDTEKSTARANIGAGTSSFDGKYSSLSGIPSAFTPAAHSHAGSEIALNATSYSKDAEQKTISKDTKVDKAVAQLEYRTDVLAENKVDKTAVSDSVSETTATITVPAKAKAVAVQKMYGKTVKITPESGDPYLANAANESVVSVGRNIYPDAFNGYTITTGGKTKSVPIKVEAGTYTITGKYTTVNYLDGYTEVQFRDDSDAVVKYINNGSSNNITFTADEASRITKSTIYINATIVGRTFKYIQMIKGTDASASVYTPYFKHTAEIPISLTSLVDYGCSAGSVYNYIDFENGLYYHNVGSVDLGILDWTYSSDTGHLFVASTTLKDKIKKTSTTTEIPNGITSVYPTDNFHNVYNNVTNKTFSVNTSGTIVIYDTALTASSIVSKKIAAFNGLMLNYELATPEVIDISDIIRPLKVESGGTVTFVNPHNIDCDTTVKYKKEV